MDAFRDRRHPRAWFIWVRLAPLFAFSGPHGRIEITAIDMDLNHKLANSINTTRDYEERGEAAERPLDMIHTSSPNILLARDTDFPYEHTPKLAYPGIARVGHDYHHDYFRVQSGHFKKKFRCPTSLKKPKTNESCLVPIRLLRGMQMTALIAVHIGTGRQKHRHTCWRPRYLTALQCR